MPTSPSRSLRLSAAPSAITLGRRAAVTLLLALSLAAPSAVFAAGKANDAYRPPNGDYGSLGTLYESQGGQPSGGGYAPSPSAPTYTPSQAQSGPYGATTGSGDVYYPPRAGGAPSASDTYRPSGGGQYGADYPPPRDGGGYGGAGSGRDYASPSTGYGEPYHPPRQYERAPDDQGPPPRDDGARRPSSYSKNEIVDAGHHFFGSVSQGLASVIEYAFQEAGRPNGYVLGEDAGGAFVAGLRYGEGTLHTKDAGNHKVFWQGPSLGYDFGAEGSKTMVLVYNLRDVSEIYNRFGGVQGSAYVIGGVSIQFQKYGDVVLAPIRSGLGLRLGANVGYLKYTRSPTWNPF